jgi:hypothetical protein
MDPSLCRAKRPCQTVPVKQIRGESQHAEEIVDMNGAAGTSLHIRAPACLTAVPMGGQEEAAYVDVCRLQWKEMPRVRR